MKEPAVVTRRPEPGFANAPVPIQGSPRFRLGFRVAVVLGRPPRLRVQDVGPVQGLVAVGRFPNRTTGSSRGLARPVENRVRQTKPVGAQDRHVHATLRRHPHRGRWDGKGERAGVVRPAEHESATRTRHVQIIERLPIGERLTRMIDRRLHVDERHRTGLVDLTEERFSQVRGQVLPFGEGPYPEHVAVGSEHRHGLSDMLGRVPVHHHALSQLELPAALTRRDDERRTAQPRHPGLEGREGAERRIQEEEAEHAALEQSRTRNRLESRREPEQILDILVGHSVECQKPVHASAPLPPQYHRPSRGSRLLPRATRSKVSTSRGRPGRDPPRRRDRTSGSSTGPRHRRPL